VSQITSDRYMTLDGEKGDMVLIPESDTAFSFRSDKHAVMAAQALTLKRANFRWEPFTDVVLTAEDERTLLVNVIVPTESTEESEAVASSLESRKDDSAYYVDFTYRGQVYKYHFAQEAEGLKFEMNR